ncbi:hypothetical protein U9M48_002125 [Paspalum notatum var. saurae]|uniref:Rx N-terminal domain-containing protein n=1 Tax=Paspalum notatum var. saurae TaxID=547442 RepID=A0AAQ3PFM7_PASNO
MADLTHSAVDSLLSLLTSAIKDEAKLLRGIPGDILFIRDEMDSMNGFLLHLTKMDTEHDDQVRAWMKQVRDIANLAQDYIRLYVRSATRHALAKKIAKLKIRVRDVGERRLRYDVKVPAANPKPSPPLVSGKDSKADDRRDEFLRALEEQSFDAAIGLLPDTLESEDGGRRPLHDILNLNDHRVNDHIGTMKMLLRALYAYPHGTIEELEKLRGKLKDRAAVPKEVMIFCYSKLSTHHKSCLQYLTTFQEESSISRTSLVRRWVAEGLVAREEGLRSMEEAGERCFDELVFRGFIRPVAIVATGLKIKSCTMDDSVRGFVKDMAESENFVAGVLPTHFDYQLKIRKIVRRQPPRQPTDPDGFSCCGVLVPRKQPLLDVDDNLLHPMDEIARLLKELPQEYRLNVLDLGGCWGLEKRHLKSICKVPSIKYLSLGNTDVSRLPKAINDLWQLETLDVRQTHLLRPSDIERIYLPRLKHLLAGHIAHCEKDGERLSTVRMPRKISKDTEVLRHVHILHAEHELLGRVGHLKKQLRKLGVVVDGSEDNIRFLLRTISDLSECLRSLSVWITAPSATAGVSDGCNLDYKEEPNGGSVPSQTPNPTSMFLESLNIKYYMGSQTNGNLPSWISGLKLLRKLTLRDTLLREESLRILGKLESLCCLRLRRGSYIEGTIRLNTEEFGKLRLLLIDRVTPLKAIAFQAEAAPNLEKVVWTVESMAITPDTISEIRQLPASLKVLELNGDWTRQRYLKETLAENKKCPLVRYSSPDPDFPFDEKSHDVSVEAK